MVRHCTIVWTQHCLGLFTCEMVEYLGIIAMWQKICPPSLLDVPNRLDKKDNICLTEPWWIDGTHLFSQCALVRMDGGYEAHTLIWPLTPSNAITEVTSQLHFLRFQSKWNSNVKSVHVTQECWWDIPNNLYFFYHHISRSWCSSAWCTWGSCSRCCSTSRMTGVTCYSGIWRSDEKNTRGLGLILVNSNKYW